MVAGGLTIEFFHYGVCRQIKQRIQLGYVKRVRYNFRLLTGNAAKLIIHMSVSGAAVLVRMGGAPLVIRLPRLVILIGGDYLVLLDAVAREATAQAAWIRYFSQVNFICFSSVRFS